MARLWCSVALGEERRYSEWEGIKMTVMSGSGIDPGLVSRVRAILMTPKTEWEVIETEPATVKSLYFGYAMILAAIPAVAQLLAGLIGSGFSMWGASVTVHTPLVVTVVRAVLYYAFSLGGLYVFALIADALAPNFGGTPGRIPALKAVVYSCTAGWLVGALSLVTAVTSRIPVLGVLIALACAIIMIGGAIYSLYLLYLGLKQLMHVPAEKAAGYTITMILIGVAVGVVVSVIIGVALAPLSMGGLMASRAASNVTLNLPNGAGSVDLNKIQSAAKEMEAAAKQAQSGQAGTGTATVAPDVLQALLPATLPGYTRSEVASASGGVGGIGGTAAHATFNKADSRIELSVVDLGPMAAMAGAFNVKANKETANGYEKVSTVNGHVTTEEYDRSSNHGSYGVMVGRFMVQAEGDKVTIEQLKDAVGAVPTGRLEALAKG
jgi:hypothetical protein